MSECNTGPVCKDEPQASGSTPKLGLVKQEDDDDTYLVTGPDGDGEGEHDTGEAGEGGGADGTGQSGDVGPDVTAGDGGGEASPVWKPNPPPPPVKIHTTPRPPPYPPPMFTGKGTMPPPPPPAVRFVPPPSAPYQVGGSGIWQMPKVMQQMQFPPVPPQHLFQRAAATTGILPPLPPPMTPPPSMVGPCGQVCPPPTPTSSGLEGKRMPSQRISKPRPSIAPSLLKQRARDGAGTGNAGVASTAAGLATDAEALSLMDVETVPMHMRAPQAYELTGADVVDAKLDQTSERTHARLAAEAHPEEDAPLPDQDVEAPPTEMEAPPAASTEVNHFVTTSAARRSPFSLSSSPTPPTSEFSDHSRRSRPRHRSRSRRRRRRSYTSPSNSSEDYRRWKREKEKKKAARAKEYKDQEKKHKHKKAKRKKASRTLSVLGHK